MPPKSRDVYTSESAGRDLFWFSSGSSAATQPVHEEQLEPGPLKHKPPPSLARSTTTTTRRASPGNHQTSSSKSRSSSVPRSPASRQPVSMRTSPSIFSLPNRRRPRRVKMVSIVEESIDSTLMTPAIVVDPPPADLELSPLKKPGPWSEWYETRDQKRFWRARKLPDETWDYQYSVTNPSAVPKQAGKPKPSSTGGRGLASFFFGIPATLPPAGPSQTRLPPNPSSPAGPRPATLFPPPPPREDESASTNSDDSTSGMMIPHRSSRLRVPAARSSGTTFPSSVSTGKGKGSSLLSIPSSQKVSSTLSKLEEDSQGQGRPVPKPNAKTVGKSKMTGGSVVKGKTKTLLLLPGGSHNKPRPVGTTAMTILSLSKPARQQQQPRTVVVPAGGDGSGGGAGGSAGNNAKKLHNKVKNEKELRIDTKRRVKGWLKDIGPEAPEPAAWDHEGLPIYK